MKARKQAWIYGPDTPTDRARTIARSCWKALVDADPAVAEQVRQLAAKHGEDHWLCPTLAPATGEWLTREQVAAKGGVRPDVVSNWTGRGLTRAGEHRTLTRHPEGYHPDEVRDFLRWRVQPAARRCLERTPSCPPIRSSRPPRSATADALTAATSSTSTPSPAESAPTTDSLRSR